MNIKCTGKFIGGELISRRGGWEGKDEHPADRKLKVYRCFFHFNRGRFSGTRGISIDQLFRRCFEKVAATQHHTPPLARNSNRSRTSRTYYSTLIQDDYRHTFQHATRIKWTRSTCKRFVRFPGRRRKKKRKTTLFSVFLSAFLLAYEEFDSPFLTGG